MGPPADVVTVVVAVWLPNILVGVELVDAEKSLPKLSMMTKLSLEKPFPLLSTNWK
jgi:hypothetical protein